MQKVYNANLSERYALYRSRIRSPSEEREKGKHTKNSERFEAQQHPLLRTS